MPWLIRFAPPLLVAGLLAALARLLDHAARSGTATEPLDLLGRVYFGLLVGAPLLLYPIAFFRRERLAWRVVLSLLPAFLWWLTEVGLRLRWHSLAESLWLAASPVNGLHLNALVLGMLIADVTCRAIAPRLGRSDQGFSRAVTLRIVIVALVLATPLLPALSVFPYLAGYRQLFQSQLLPMPEARPGPAASESLASAPASNERPNIVFILSDDHRWDVMGHEGHAFAETPSLDRLAAEGVRFTRAYVNSSLCSPSRASFLTGTHPHRHGVWNNFTPWSNENQTLLEHLGAAGYATAFIGKWHMPGGLPELRGVDHFVTFTAMGGQGVYRDCPLIVHGQEMPSRKRYIAEELTDRALEWIEANRAAPFALYLSHKNVHSPFTPDTREAGRHAEVEVELPSGAHPWAHFTNAQYVHLSHRSLPDSVRSYVEAVESMDRQIGRLLAGLDEMGLADDTLVIYTSDNGYLWGEHGLVDKRWAYEESMRIPLLVRFPALGHAAGLRVDRLVQNIDLMPTLLEAAGLAVPSHVQGKSWLRLIVDPEKKWRDAVYYAYYFEPPYPTPSVEGLRTDTFKYLEYDGMPTQLFDLQKDPRETHNLAEEPEYRAVREELARRLSVERRGAR